MSDPKIHEVDWKLVLNREEIKAKVVKVRKEWEREYEREYESLHDCDVHL